MIINGKEYSINTNLKFKTEKFMSFCLQHPEDPKVLVYTELILKDMLIPEPSGKELGEFRRSDTENILIEYARLMKEKDSDFKKKLSQ